MQENESLERAFADLEMLTAAYPDETSVDESSCNEHTCTDALKSFPLHVTLMLSETALIKLAMIQGYPVETGIRVVSYRSSPKEKAAMEEAVTAVRTTASECLQDAMEGGFACCAAALQVWGDHAASSAATLDESSTAPTDASADASQAASSPQPPEPEKKVFHWISGEPLTDRKSTFQAHVCRVASERDVQDSFHQLVDSNSKMQRATHHMNAFRFTERLVDSDTVILKHDNDDDGEDAAGSRLAHLLEMRREDGVFCVVSRWFGGIHLGPKRFAHITNVAGQLLLHCHANEWKDLNL